MKKILLFALPLLALLCTSCEKEKEEVWTDDSPIIEFTNLEFLSSLLKLEWDDYEGKSYPVDRNGDGQISEKEASFVKHLFIDDAGLTDIEEIKYFTGVIELRCDSNQLTSFDVSNNAALRYLNCSGNQITTLDVSKNTALTELKCNNNQLTTLDLSGCTALETLSCDNNPLEKIRINVKNNLPQSTINYYKDIIEYVQ